MKKKMEILTQGTFRRLHNTCELVDDETKVGILDKYMEDLKLSGYDEKERMNVLQNEIKQFTMLRLKTSYKGLEIIFIVVLHSD